MFEKTGGSGGGFGGTVTQIFLFLKSSIRYRILVNHTFPLIEDAKVSNRVISISSEWPVTIRLENQRIWRRSWR